MKSKILSLAVAVLIFSAAQAQSIHLGIKGGTNINKISGESFNQKFTYGYHLGGFAEIGLGTKWALQPEVLFNEINADTSSQFSKIYTSLPSNVKNVKLRYLSIPILLDYKVSNLFALQAGPQFGILMNHDNSLVQDGKSAFKKGDFSMLAGVQLKIASLRIYGRYAIGLNNINDIDNKDKWKSQSFQLGIGLALL
ncbi:MAG: PorT family protein [Ferruginibacter sp.]|nr:PorT family protein [Ferruginibacter sp.]